MEEVDLTKGFRERPSELVESSIEDSQGREEGLVGVRYWKGTTADQSIQS